LFLTRGRGLFFFLNLKPPRGEGREQTDDTNNSPPNTNLHTKRSTPPPKPGTDVRTMVGGGEKKKGGGIKRECWGGARNHRF